ncbi:helix-turn-helix domain-containing protein [Paenibacillus arenosi]|uniref:Helix-turn-helix transcriptional regulator n=1 Tax=Paenibacillus arenosi TaxID=2774142 RepID=A0ABR9AUV5_9BACL|nr:helix-turn-helix transcriptional regulator [Paenibacillus arenosi]MBD8497890.1 helix-turn-helix transcriptional regulator [Paenibacillus arenosi]
MTKDIIVHDLQNLIDVPREYYSISIPKMEITRCIKNELGERNLSIRKLADEVGMKHPQIIRVTSGENYNIETLLKILDALDLEIVLQKRVTTP